jgi:hypothetical protein
MAADGRPDALEHALRPAQIENFALITECLVV